MSAAVTADRLAHGVDYGVRDGVEDDIAFILDTWRWAALRAERDGTIDRATYFRALTPRVLAALRRSRVRVAHDIADPTNLLGWAVLEGPVLHYVLVRRGFERQGIARALLDGERIEEFSHKPRDYRGAPAGWKFNPWAFVPFKE